MTQNQRTMRRDAYDPPSAHDLAAKLFRSRRQLEVENLFLRHQLNIALRRAPRRLRLHGADRAVLVWLTRLWPSLIGLARVVQPDTILSLRDEVMPVVLLPVAVIAAA
jgi:hypothetical protein